MNIVLDNSISAVNFNNTSVTEVQWNGIKVWPVTPLPPLGEFDVRLTFLNGLTSSITFDNGVVPVRVKPLYNNSDIAKVEVGSGITKLDYDSFRYNSNLSSVTLGESVSLIQQCSFGEAYSLSEITCYASDAPTLGSGGWGGVFRNASPSGTLYVPQGSDYSSWVDMNSATSGMKLASGWTIEYFDVPVGDFDVVLHLAGDTIEVYTYEDGIIPYNEFSQRNDIEWIEIGDGITTIGGSAFYNCNIMSAITIGSGLTTIGDYAFWNCYHLQSITIPNSVTSLGQYALQNCTSLSSITFGDGITSISYGLLDHCTSLSSITCYATTAPIVTTNYRSFLQLPASGTLYVPQGSDYSSWIGTAYQSSDKLGRSWTIQYTDS